MTIYDYVKDKEFYKDEYFQPMYLLIVELIKDGYLKADDFDRVCKYVR